MIEGTAFYIAVSSGRLAYCFNSDGSATGQTNNITVDDSSDILDAINAIKPAIENVYFREYAASAVSQVDFVEEIPI